MSPGIHLRAIQRSLQISLGSTRYHVRRLVLAGALTCESDGGFSRVYPTAIDEKERIVYSLLRNRACRGIVKALIGEPRLASSRIIQLTGLPKSVVSEQTRRLREFFVIRAAFSELGKVYELIDPARISRILAQTAPSRLEKAVQNYIELWDF